MVTSNTTYPSIDDVAIMLMVAVRLSGVKTTSKRLAVKPEFSWQAASEVDRRTFSAAAGRTAVASVDMRRRGFSEGSRILNIAGRPPGREGSD